MMYTLGQWFNFERQRQSELLPAELSGNLDLFNRFIHEAHKIRDTGREHYSARTIAEYIRHNTAVSGEDNLFKVNNNVVPVMARSAMQMFPYLNGLFELRG